MRDNLLVASEEGRHSLRIRLDPQEPTRVVATERLLQDAIGGVRSVSWVPMAQSIWAPGMLWEGWCPV